MTAVEWLVEQILDVPLDDSTNAAHLKEYVCKISVFNQALEMEKEQIIKAHGIQTFKSIKQGIDFWDIKTGEQYYNETYKKY